MKGDDLSQQTAKRKRAAKTAIVALVLGVLVLIVVVKQFPQKATALLPEGFSISSCRVTRMSSDNVEDSPLTKAQQEELLEKLRQKELDLVICDLRIDDNLEAIEKYFFAEEPILSAISTRSSLAEQPAVDIQQLENLECVLLIPPKAREKEEQHYQKLFNFFGKYFYPPQFFYSHFAYNR